MITLRQRGTDHVGFIAHEFLGSASDAVSGEKDGMRIEEKLEKSDGYSEC